MWILLWCPARAAAALRPGSMRYPRYTLHE